MAWMSGAVRKPLPNPSKTKMARYDVVVVHTMVGSLVGTDGYFRGLTNGVNSHFGTGGLGEIWQWVDTAVRSGANGAGNHRAITIENADMGPGFSSWNTRDGAAVPAFTPAQIEANAQICAWAHLAHGVPLVAVDTSRPNVRGIGYHRLGCNPWRVPDGELWSSATGKVCPGVRRIAQINQIIERAKQIVAGADAEENDMYDDKARGEVVGRLDEAIGLLRSIHPAVASLQVGVMDPSSGVRTLVLQLAGRDPVEVDSAELVEALAPTLVPAIIAALDEKAGLTKGDVKEAVSEILASLQSAVTPDPR